MIRLRVKEIAKEKGFSQAKALGVDASALIESVPDESEG